MFKEGQQTMRIKEILKKKTYIKTNYYVHEIGVFGSFIRSEQSKKSDIDILVEFEDGHKDFFNYMRLKYYLEDVFGKRERKKTENSIESEAFCFLCYSLLVDTTFLTV